MKTHYDVVVFGGGTAGVDPADLPVEDIHALLREHGAVVPERVSRRGGGHKNGHKNGRIIALSGR